MNPPSLNQLKEALTESLAPNRLILRRLREGALDLRILSGRFAETEDPLSLVTTVLKEKGLQLPERTLTILRAPDELEEGEEDVLFSEAILGTPTWADALSLEPEADIPDDRQVPPKTKVVAFWGLKGGVGRSTALSHVSLLLGKRQVRVLAIDLDLESPALVAALGGENVRREQIRFEELVALAGSSEIQKEDLQRRVESALTPSMESALVNLLGPVQADSLFVRALLGPLSPAQMYRGGSSSLRNLIATATEVSRADVVLIDARSGYCDESAVAVLDLADEVVLFASPSPNTYPSFAPAIEALERNRQAKGRPSVVHIVAGMTPAGEEARKRILETLESELEQARAFVADTLATKKENLPPDIVITTLDYSARIVENDGGLRIGGVTEGYCDLADKIYPPPLPKSILTTAPGWAQDVLREATVPAPQAESEPNPSILADLFTRTPDLENFLRHDNFLVRGAKGTGKSYLRRICLEHQDLLGTSHTRERVLFVDGYSAPRGPHKLSPPINQDLLRQLDEKFEDRWAEIWSILSLSRSISALSINGCDWLPSGLPEKVTDLLLSLAVSDKYQEAGALVSALMDTDCRLALSDAWLELDQWLQTVGRYLTLLFDDLDIALGETDKGVTRRRHMIIGLLDQAHASWFSSRNLGVKVFLRSDVFNQLGTDEQAKYRDRGFELNWRSDDIWRLTIRAMSVASASFRKELENRGISTRKLEEMPKDDWENALELIWGERMGGSGESNTRTTTWAEKRLRDAKGQLFPRAALWLLQGAVETRKAERVEVPPLLDARSLRDAMPEVAEKRLDELLAESDQKLKDRVVRLKGFKSYQDRAEFLEELKNVGETDEWDALKKLEGAGVIETGARRDKTPTTRIVDLYAFAPKLEIQRLGRR